MPQTYDLVIRNGAIVNQDGINTTDIGIVGEKIIEIGDLASADAGEMIDASGLHILPGVIDSQVHFREPGGEHKEDLETGSLAAVMGGVTSVFEMPNTNPLTVSAAALEDKLRRADGRMHCDHAFWVGGTHDNVDDLPELERLPGAAGIKVFMGSSTGDLLVEDEEGLAAILAKINRRAAFHSEDEARLIERLDKRVKGDPSSHPVWRDVETATQSTERLVRLARENGARIHVLHISTAEEMDFLRDQKDIASVEVTPNHLSRTDSDYATLGTLVQMNPPIRDKEVRQALWHAVGNGIADILGSDHAPHTREEKEELYPDSPSGMPGVQTLVPVMLNHVTSGRLSLQRFVDMTSAGPARLFGIASKGRIAAGYDADLTLADMNRTETIKDEWIASKAGWTPYDGMDVTGWPVGTIIRGKRVMWEGELVTAHSGKPVRFLECLRQ